MLRICILKNFQRSVDYTLRMRWWKTSHKKFATLKSLLGQDVEQLPKYENKKQLANDFNDLYQVETIIASILNAIATEILKAEVNSMSSFTELSISLTLKTWFRRCQTVHLNWTSFRHML